MRQEQAFPSFEDIEVVYDHLKQAGYVHAEPSTLSFKQIADKGISRSTYKMRISGAGEFLLSVRNIPTPTREETTITVQNFMHDHGVSTPTVIGGIGTLPDGRSFKIKPYIHHRDIDDITPEVAKQIGQEMAKTHLVGQTLLETHPELDFSNQLGRNHRLKHRGKMVAHLAQAVIGHKETNWEALADHTHAKITGQNKITEPLPSGIVHGDIHKNNILLDMEGRLHLIDWEFNRISPFIQDLAYAAVQLSTGEPFNRHHFNADVLESLIQGYQEVRPLEPEEIRAFPKMLRNQTNYMSFDEPMRKKPGQQADWSQIRPEILRWTHNADMHALTHTEPMVEHSR